MNFKITSFFLAILVNGIIFNTIIPTKGKAEKALQKLKEQAITLQEEHNLRVRPYNQLLEIRRSRERERNDLQIYYGEIKISTSPILQAANDLAEESKQKLIAAHTILKQLSQKYDETIQAYEKAKEAYEKMCETKKKQALLAAAKRDSEIPNFIWSGVSKPKAKKANGRYR